VGERFRNIDLLAKYSREHMKSIASVATGFFLFMTMASVAAEDIHTILIPAITVYEHILKTETVIESCRRSDATNATSYEELYRKYHDEIAETVIRIGLLVGKEFRRVDIEEQEMWKSLGSLTDSIAQTVERMVRIEPERFSRGCQTLPDAIIAGKKPFELLSAKFPKEMEIIRSRP
jgi:hypothetical protein